LETFFKGLDITVGTYYIRFQDEDVRDTLKNYMIGLGLMKSTETISTENAKSVVSLSSSGASIFMNSMIGSFDELNYFTGITQIGGKMEYSGGNAKEMGDFYGCNSLKSINLENITFIGEYAFKNSGLEVIYAPKLNSLGQEAFTGNTNLKAIQSLGTTTTIPTKAFSGCTSLTTVTLPKECTSINASAFSGCTSLKHIYLPNLVYNLGDYMFDGCTNLTTIYWNYTGLTTPSTPMAGGFGPKVETIYVSQELYTKIEKNSTWASYKNIIKVYDFEKDPNKIIPEEHKK
jgi:hypothetical protein